MKFFNKILWSNLSQFIHHILKRDSKKWLESPRFKEPNEDFKLFRREFQTLKTEIRSFANEDYRCAWLRIETSQAENLDGPYDDSKCSRGGSQTLMMEFQNIFDLINPVNSTLAI